MTRLQSIERLSFVFSLIIGINTTRLFAQDKAKAYPEVTGYFSVLVPGGTWTNGAGWSPNFKSSTAILFPTGINIVKSKKIGFGLQIDPTVTSSRGSSTISSISVDPSLVLFLASGFSIAPRLSFETSGRYGLTPVFSKVVERYKDYNFFLALAIPIRSGGRLPASIGAGILLGIGF